jgi:bla regulator protein blaR1
MIGYLVEATLRTLALALIVQLGIASFRIRNPFQEKLIWTTALAGALAMPALVRWTFMPTLAAMSFPLPIVGSVYSLGGHSVDARDPSSDGLAVLTSLYVGISLVLLARMAIGAYRMWRIRLSARPIREDWTDGLDVRLAQGICNPATFGRSILLPPGFVYWTEAKRAMVLCHEATHVRHYDSPIQWLAGLHACLFWFNPLAWWLRRRLAQLAEYVCDDEVLRLNLPKADYAAVLLEEAAAHTPGSMLVSTAGRSLEQRIDRVLRTTQPGRTLSHGRRALAVLSVIPVIALASEGVGQHQPAEAGGRPATDSQPQPPPHYTDIPNIIGGPSLGELMRYYPPEAQRQGIDGLVQISVALDEQGRATDTHILSETPAGMGFGAAASEIAHQFKYANPTDHPAWLTYKIKFELRH